MSHPAESHHGSSIGLRAVTLATLAVFTIQIGCSRAPESNPMAKAREALASNIVFSDVEPAQVVDGSLERFGRLGIAMTDEVPRFMNFVLRQTLVRGTEDAVLEVFDEKTGERTVYTVNNETGDAWVHYEGGKLHMVFNADKTIMVGDKLAANEDEAAMILIETGALKSVSEYSLFTMIEVISKYLPEDKTGKGGAAAVVVLIAVGVWYVGSTVGCSQQYKRNGCKLTGLSNYCRSWCASYWCHC
ncbi:hypothetical protein LZ198_02710 [Myxococcus sp. K15C18031901]|uniref:hypothetical protein n=1 Tax=Myxococcus dinghuensis TaxID=2906761 RepID=UPI0020A76C62|nr:hypothetical protein [Myxococcus dinghuensis]MCP3097780.1 hypothetical protein [Myxococcus dinghuensis]